jgi:hypothetical protein
VPHKLEEIGDGIRELYTNKCLVPSVSSTERDSRAKSASIDADLIAVSRNFRCKLREWIKQIGKHDIESYDEKTEVGRTLHALRTEWGSSLATLRSLVPRTVDGANEKLAAAQVFLEFTCEVDGSAIELLALAARELDHVRDTNRTSNQTQTSRRASAQGPFWWLEWLTRRV